MGAACVADVAGPNSHVLESLEGLEELLFVVDLVCNFILACLQPLDKGEGVLGIVKGAGTSELVGPKGGVSALRCYLSQTHFEIHAGQQNHFDVVDLGDLLNILLLKQCYDVLDGTLQVRSALKCFIDESRLKLHG